MNEDKQDNVETSTENAEAFTAKLMHEISVAIQSAVSTLREKYWHLDVQVPAQLLTEREREYIGRLTQKCFLHNASRKEGLQEHRFVVADQKPTGEEREFTGIAAQALAEFAKVCDVPAAQIALGMYLERLYAGKNATLSISEVAREAHTSMMTIRRTLRLYFQAIHSLEHPGGIDHGWRVRDTSPHHFREKTVPEGFTFEYRDPTAETLE